MGDLVWVRIFSPKPLVIAFISRHTTVQDFFSSFIRHERYFFQCRNQSAGYFCLKSPFPPPPLQSQMVGPYKYYTVLYRTGKIM